MKLGAWASLLWLSTLALAGECRWHVDDTYRGILFPDLHVTYARFPFTARPDASVRVEVTGAFPRSRYFSIGLYDAERQRPVRMKHDTELVPDGKGGYTVVFSGKAKRRPNEILLPPLAASRPMEIWLRLYLPETRAKLPEVRLLDEASGEALECAPPGPPESAAALGVGSLPVRSIRSPFRFTTSRGEALQENSHNLYRIAQLDLGRGGRDVALVRWRPPTIRRADDLASRAEASARYWSLCVASFSGWTTGCLADESLDSREEISVVVGPARAESLARERGYFFLPVTGAFAPVVIARALLPTAGTASLSPEPPSGRYLSLDALRALPKREATRSVEKTFSLGARGCERAPGSLRVAASLSFAYGRIWGVEMQGKAGRGAGALSLLMALKATAEEMATKRSGARVTLGLQPPDLIAAELAGGCADFGIFFEDELPYVLALFPDLRPVLGGSWADPKRGEALLVAHEDLYLDKNLHPETVEPRDLVGLKLAAFPQPSDPLFALHDYIDRNGLAEKGPFHAKSAGHPSAEDAFEALFGEGGSDEARPDVALTSRDAWDAYRSNRPGRSKRLFPLLSLGNGRRPWVLRAPGKTSREASRLLEKLVGQAGRIDLDEREFLQSGLARALRADRWLVVGEEEASDIVSRGKKRLEKAEHYLLPAYFLAE